MVKGTGKLRAGGMPEHEVVTADTRIRNLAGRAGTSPDHETVKAPPLAHRCADSALGSIYGKQPHTYFGNGA